MGVNIGVEIYGKGKEYTRPVIVFKKFGSVSFLGIPLTSKMRTGSWYATFFHGEREMCAILNQIKVFDGMRLTKRIGAISRKNFTSIKKAFVGLYGS